MRSGWQAKSLDQLATVVNGGTPKTKVEKYWGGNNLWVTPAEMGKRKDPFINVTQRTLSNEGLQNSSASLVPASSVIMSTRAPIGHLVINTEPMAFNQGCRGMVPGDELDVKYLYYFLLGNVKLLNDLGTGATFKELSAGKLKSVPVPYPLLEEQKRIVTILDEAFAGIDTAIANTEQNLANSRELFESYLNVVFSQKGEGWSQVTLSEATGGIYTGPFGSLLHKSDYVENEIPLVNPAHITEVGIEADFRKTISKETAQRLKSYIMREGDIVIGRRGEMGRCAIVTAKEDGWLCGTGSFFIKSSSQCDSRYLVRLLRSEGCKRRLEKIAGGAVMPNLSNKDLGSFLIDFPPLAQQVSFVQKIDELHDEVQQLESIYNQKLESLKELKQSLLQKVFSGELTAEGDKLMDEAAA